jgi:hypothetical protein
MYKKPKYANTVNGQNIRIYDNWNARLNSRHFVVITRIEPVEKTTVTKQHAYPTFEDAMSKVPALEKWMQNNQI